MRSKFILIALLALAVAGCANRNVGVASADRPGTTIRFKNPNPEKWAIIPTATRTGPRASIYVCKPLACSGSAAVALQSTRSPTRHPDRAALEKAAKLLLTQAKAQDMMSEAASDGDERVSPVSSKVTEIRGYPAILAETKHTTRGKVRYMLKGHLFIGLQLVQITSMAPKSPEAKRNFDEFVAMLEILDFEPGAPATEPATEPEPAETSGTPTAAAPEQR